MIMSRLSKILFCLSLLVGTLGFSLFISRNASASLEVGVLSIDYQGAPGPLFSVDKIAPGYSEIKSVMVTNNGLKPHSFSIAVTGSLGSLANVMRLRPVISGQTNPVWDKTIKEIADTPGQSKIIVGSIAPESSITVDIQAYLPSDVGNEYQGTSTLSFNFLMGNESTDQAEDAGVSGQDAASAARNIVATRQPSANEQTGEIAQQDETNQSQNPAVLGETDSDKTQGAKDESGAICFWWWVLSIVLAVFLFIWGYINNKREIIFSWFWPVFVAAVFYFLHWGLHDFFQPSKYCKYFIIIEMALLALYYITTSYVKEEAEEDN